MKSDSYEDFVEKFKPKKTTDDCYNGVEWNVSRDDSMRIGALDMQRVRGIGAYGGALLLSDKAAAERAAAERAAAERAAAERAAAERWRLSPREQRIAAGLGKK